MRYLNIIFFALILSLQAIGQKTATITTAIVVEKDVDVGLTGVTAKLFQTGKEISSVTTNAEGVVTFKLEPNSEYVIEFSKQGYVSKIVNINTKIPNYETNEFEIALSVLLFVPCEGLDYSVLQNPVVKIVYDDLKRDFFNEKTYSNTMNNKLEQLMKANDKCVEDKYQTIVKKADRLFAEKKYAESRDVYLQAQSQRPDDKYVEKQIDEINKILADQKDNDKAYKDYIARADVQFNAKKYALAKEIYKQALLVKPGAEYPTKQIAAIDQLLAKQSKEEQDQQKKEEQYQQAMDRGNDAYDGDVCGKALPAYREALAAKPNDPVALQKVANAEKKCKDFQSKQAGEKDKQKYYKAAIARADSLFKLPKYNDALVNYQAALNIYPNEPYPANQIDIINELLKKQAKELESRYKSLMTDGDDAIDSDPCGKSLNSYREALKLKPNDKPATDKLAIADKKCKDVQAKASSDKDKQRKYNAAIAKADSLYKKPKYNEALAAYQSALTIIPGGKYPLDQIDLINDILAKQNKDLESRYKALISAGDDALETDACGQSINSYKEALKLKPNDQVATEKITIADKKCKDMQAKASSEKEKQKKYKAAIAKADSLYKLPKYTDAISAYQAALGIITTEKYPADQIDLINDLLSKQNKDLEAKYKALIKDGDKKFDNEDLVNAKTSFQQALGLKPNEAYPKEKIKAIDAILAEMAKVEADKKAKRDQFNKLVADADAAFKKPDYNKASTLYQQALQLISSEPYPKQKLDEIDKILQAQADKLERDYNAKIQSGDRNYNTQVYAQALQDYKDALVLKPTEPYPSQRINDINKILADQAKTAADLKAKKDAYAAAVAKADQQFKATKYDDALLAYKEATTYLPAEKYPFTKIDEINNIKKQMEMDANYKKAISSGDSYLGQKQYQQSKSFYNQALGFKPNDKYALDQIAKIDQIQADELKRLADAKSRQDAYDKAIADGDKNLTAKDYQLSKSAYQTATAIFPDKPYPKQKIADIDKLLKEIELNNNYKAKVDEANAYFASKVYDQAKQKYKDALTLKPAEQFPQEKIKEIDKILAQLELDKQKLAEMEKNYIDAIAQADGLFDKAQYDASQKEYERSLTYKPNEAYPKQRLARIREIKSMLAKEQKAAATPSAAKQAQSSGVKIVALNFKTDTEREIYLKELLAKYPPGITCEVYKEKGKELTRYIIVRDNQANEFRSIQYNWGVEYFRNDKPITYLYFNNQIKTREGEYFTKTDM
jgi:hypothetical protein